jgi:L-methionine (R)-S-oxide reductase
MYRSKSDTLDEFRYQIGKYGDHAKVPKSFIQKVNRLITSEEYIYNGAYAYSCKSSAFHLVSQSGIPNFDMIVPFGDNHLSLCAIRGDIQVFRTDERIQINVPCYNGHHLLGQLVVYSDQHHHIDQDDFDFLREVVEFVKIRIINI